MPPGGISATSSFFDLGGTSVDILRLRNQLETRFGCQDLSLADLMQSQTVRELARRLGATPAAADYNPIVTFQPNGQQTPLFCFHPGPGEVLVFIGLANRFAGERPVHALRTRGFNRGETPFTSIPEMVESYVKGIRSTQPKGPYTLLGYSFGGVIAFEAAKALERDGEKVAYLGVINTPPDLREPRKSLEIVDSPAGLAHILSLITKEQSQELPKQWRQRGLTTAEACADILRVASKRRLAELNLDLPKFSLWVEVAFSSITISRTYEPSGTVEAMSVFYTSPPALFQGLSKETWVSEKLKRWETFSRQLPKYIEVPGEHHKILVEQLDTFEKLLRQELAERKG